MLLLSLTHNRWHIENNIFHELEPEWHLEHFFIHSPTGVETVLMFITVSDVMKLENLRCHINYLYTYQ